MESDSGREEEEEEEKEEEEETYEPNLEKYNEGEDATGTNVDGEQIIGLTERRPRGQAMSQTHSPPPKKRRKIVRKVKDDMVSLTPTERLAEAVKGHVGVRRFRTFDGIPTGRKEEVGRRLETLLDSVADGSLNPLMYFTLKGDLIEKLVELRGLLPSILTKNLGISTDTEFPLMSEGEKEDIGAGLGRLLRQISRGALVPLLSSALNVEEVKKLCNLKGIRPTDLELEGASDNDNNIHRLVERPHDDNMNDCLNEGIAEADADIPNWTQDIGKRRRPAHDSNHEEDSMKELSRYNAMFDSVPDEVVLDLIKVAARQDEAETEKRRKTYPPLAWPRLATLATPKYNHDFIIDVVSKISDRFNRLAHDRSLWEGTVMISLDGDFLDDEEKDEWIYGEKKADQIIDEWLNDGTERLWVEGENYCPKVPTFNFVSLAKQCPNLKTLLLYSVELDEALSPSFEMSSLEDLFLHNVKLVHSDPFLNFDWKCTFPRITLFGMWPDIMDHGGCWCLLPDLRECENIREVYLIDGRFSFPTNILRDVPFPKGLEKLMVQHNGLTDNRWWGKKDLKKLCDMEVISAVMEHAPGCRLTCKNLGGREAVCHRIHHRSACPVPRVTMDSVGSDDSEHEEEERSEDADARLCAVCGVQSPSRSRCGRCRRVSYCSREHQRQHWKNGGHGDACSGTCKRCLEPMSANGGECFVEHPSHLCKEDTICTIKPGGLVRQNALCLACDSNLVISVCECGDCAKDCRAILEGPRFCFKGKHTIEALPVSDKRRVSRNVITILAKHNMQRKIDAALSPKNESKVKVLNFPNGGNNEKITASISHKMSNLTSLRIMDVTLKRLLLTAELTPRLLELRIRNIPDNCKFQVVVPTLKIISIHHYSPVNHRSCGINDMLSAASEVEEFETYKLCVTGTLQFASNHLKSIELYQSDGLSGISLWAPNLQTLSLRKCYSIKTINVLKSHRLAERLPGGHEPTTFWVNTINSNISTTAMAALTGSGRCRLIKDSGSDNGLLGTGSFFQFMHKFQDEEGDEGLLGLLKGWELWNDQEIRDMDG